MGIGARTLLGMDPNDPLLDPESAESIESRRQSDEYWHSWLNKTESYAQDVFEFREALAEASATAWKKWRPEQIALVCKFMLLVLVNVSREKLSKGETFQIQVKQIEFALREAALAQGPDARRGIKVLAGARTAHSVTHGNAKEKGRIWAAMQTMLDEELGRNPNLSFTQASKIVANRLSKKLGKNLTARSVRNHARPKK